MYQGKSYCNVFSNEMDGMRCVETDRMVGGTKRKRISMACSNYSYKPWFTFNSASCLTEAMPISSEALRAAFRAVDHDHFGPWLTLLARNYSSPRLWNQGTEYFFGKELWNNFAFFAGSFFLLLVQPVNVWYVNVLICSICCCCLATSNTDKVVPIDASKATLHITQVPVPVFEIEGARVSFVGCVPWSPI